MSKFCSNCGVQVTDESVFCPHCGARFETDFQQPYQAPTDTQYQQPYQAQPNNQYQQPYANPTPYGQYPQQNSYQPRPYYQQAKPKVPGRGFGITSMVLGIIACAFCTSWISLALRGGYARLGSLIFDGILAGLALTFALLAKSKGYKKQATAGLILAAIACGIVVLSAILFTATGHMITSGGINYYYSY